MNQSYTRSLLYSIADKIGRKRIQMDKFIKVLQENWYDSKEAVASMTNADFQKFQIPQRLVQLIKQEVGNRPQNKQTQKMDIQSPAQDFLRNISRLTTKENFQQKLELLNKIFTNIRQNLIDEKYRVLKKSNPKISQLTQNKHVVNFLNHGGFVEVNPGFVMQKVNISNIDQCLDAISKFMPKIQFNPYQSHISSIGDTNISTYEGDSSVAFNQKLAKLQAQRQKMMSKPIKDREIKIFQIQPTIANKFDQQFNQDKEYNNEDERLYLQSMKEILKKQGEEGKFMNRRKQEYLDLVKKPCFTQTIIRIKLPDNWIFQCICAPLQTLQTLVDIFNQSLQNKQLDYYLYMTPPVQKLSGLLLRKTFYQLGCVPRAIFYFKCEQPLKGNIFKIKKTTKLFNF